MKGIVFTEFFSLVEDLFGRDMVDEIIGYANPPSGGAYTSLGTYDHGEMVSLLTALSKRSNIPVPDLLRTFGKALFGRFSKLYPHFFENVDDLFAFLKNVEGTIHVEVAKLYPDAELPRFDTLSASATELVLLYKSSRHMEDFAYGLILGAIDYFNATAIVERQAHANGVQFTITRIPETDLS